MTDDVEAETTLRRLTWAQNQTRGYVRSGGMVDVLIVLAGSEVVNIVGAGKGVDRVAYVAVTALFGAAITYYLRKRRNLGAGVQLPTWVFAGLNFAGTPW